jgi:hypothetical protein
MMQHAPPPAPKSKLKKTETLETMIDTANAGFYGGVSGMKSDRPLINDEQLKVEDFKAEK